MKKALLLCFTILTFQAFSQITFEKGYFIDNTDQRIECLIKNVDWRNNPSNFQYKLNESDEPIEARITDVKEFGIYNSSKFLRSVVKIDRSTEETNKLSKDRNPRLEEEQLFLKVLNEGKANLYSYYDTGLRRFFLSKDGLVIEQLVFKKYETPDGKLGINNYYKQQLLKQLKCSDITLRDIENTDYKSNSLVKLFIKYNSCNGSNTTSYKETNSKADLFNLTLRPQLRFSSSLSIFYPLISSRDINIGKKSQFGFGIETEFILGFNKNKWAIIAEPTYQGFKSSETFDSVNISGGKIVTDVNYSSIEIPIGVRHYFFLNDDSKIFINASYILDFVLDSSVEFKRIDNSTFNSFEIDTNNNLAFGAGFKYNDRYSVELRYLTSRDILSNDDLNSNYNVLSIILGYSIF